LAALGFAKRDTSTRARVGCKENQGKPRKKAGISLDSFGRIGLFQWVTEKKIKKTAAGLTRVQGCAYCDPAGEKDQSFCSLKTLDSLYPAEDIS
jgi:hypothetical protein